VTSGADDRQHAIADRSFETPPRPIRYDASNTLPPRKHNHYCEDHGLISTVLTALAGDPFTILELMAR